MNYQQITGTPEIKQNHYVLFCEDLLWEMKNYYDFEGAARTLSINRQKELIAEWYWWGQTLYKVLNCAYTDFELALLEQGGVYPQHLRRTRLPRITTWFEIHGVDFRQKKKYQRRTGHQKKVKSYQDQQRQDWRERKGFKKDHQKNVNFILGETRFFKRESNRNFRHHANQKIKEGRYDEIVDILEYSQEWDWYY